MTTPKVSVLDIERIFTKEGEHPYDTVNWEKRDVVQENWKTGETIFRQEGVEFPATWSSNASTIVTTKYFRGKVDTPEREWSLKQLIDRVVKTYVGAARKYKYITSPKKLEIFEHELTYLLLHQYFSFNSPVWFNVGTKSSQQVSACQPYDALVSTPSGMIPIGKLVEENAVGTKVYDAEGITKIIATKANGIKEVLRLHLHSGQSLDVTGDHLVWKASGPNGQGKFVEAKNLSVGDMLEWHRRESYGESEINAYAIQEAALVGWLQSDGFVGQYEHGTNRSLTIEAMTVNDAELEWVTKSINSVFPDVHSKERNVETQSEELDCRRTRLYGESLRPFVMKWDLLTRGRDMEIPESMFTAPLPVVAAYLRSIFQAEGYVSERKDTDSTLVGVGMVSEKIIKGMQTLLMRFGIFSRVNFKFDPRPSRQGGHWSLHLQNLGDRIIFADEIGFIDPIKTEKLYRSFTQKGLQAKDIKRLAIKKIENLGNMEVYDIQTESGEYLSENLKVHNCFILSVDDSMDSILNWYREEGLIFKGGSGAGVNLSRLRSSKEILKNSGGTSSGPVSFMRGADASAGTIKSGGATRRAAKMIVLDVDHPDIEEFVETKAHEEGKIRVLRDAGYDMDLGGKDIISVQYQNANNSVRVDDTFMNAVKDDKDYNLIARTTSDVVESINAPSLFRKIAEAAWSCADPGIQYKDTINHWHTNKNTGPITASNPCSEFLSLDNSSCNLASLNLMKFRKDNGTFDYGQFIKVVELVFTAMDVSISFGDFPTEKIGEVTRAFRQIGIGYTNLGALLMSSGIGYDSREGRAYAAAITSLMSAVSYRRSAEIAGVVGPYDGFEVNKEPHMEVMDMHRAEANGLVSVLNGEPGGVFVEPGMVTSHHLANEIAMVANREWEHNLEIGEKNGWRNAQASLLAPTGCLTGDTLVNTSHGLLRLDELGNPNGDIWQDLSDIFAATDEGPKKATKFFVNGEAPVRKIMTKYGSELTGTYTHQLKVYDPETKSIIWKHMMDLNPGDLLTMPKDTIIGSPRKVSLPILEQPYYAGHTYVTVPENVTPELAELVGYFMGDGSLHSKGIRLCAADTDLDVTDYLGRLVKEVFSLETIITQRQGYSEVAIHSTAIANWWQASGFAKTLPNKDHKGKGWSPHVPTAIRETNDPEIWKAFLRGLFEADGTASLIYSNGANPTLSSKDKSFMLEIGTLFRTLGYATTTSSCISETGRYSQERYYRIRLRNLEYVEKWNSEIGFISERKSLATRSTVNKTSGRQDRIPVDINHLRSILFAEHKEIYRKVRTESYRSANRGNVPELSRGLLTNILTLTDDIKVRDWLNYWYEPVVANEDAGEQMTYDISVPENVTYIANGITSHNTISFMMDSDTTGVEPDFSLVKFKKMVGGGSLQIVNSQVSEALRSLGYGEHIVKEIEEYILEHGNVEGASGLAREHYDVFDCAVGERAISAMGHIKMMAAIQPFLSGALSKTINLPESATVEEIEEVYYRGWELGLKAIAVYRDNCKVGQPLSDGKAKKKNIDTFGANPQVVEKIVEKFIEKPARRKLPKKRSAETVSFTVGGSEGYLTAGLYEDGSIGELFVKMSKQGSTLAGIMDAFSIAVSLGLQHGVPLEAFVGKFTNMRFEPSGMTDDPDIRMAQSLVDYMFRRIALDHVSFDIRSEYGIYTTKERTAALNSENHDIVAMSSGDDDEDEPDQSGIAPPARGKLDVERAHESSLSSHSLKVEAPLCPNCGTASGMTKTGACWACAYCGNSTGCS